MIKPPKTWSNPTTHLTGTRKDHCPRGSRSFPPPRVLPRLHFSWDANCWFDCWKLHYLKIYFCRQLNILNLKNIYIYMYIYTHFGINRRTKTHELVSSWHLHPIFELEMCRVSQTTQTLRACPFKTRHSTTRCPTGSTNCRGGRQEADSLIFLRKPEMRLDQWIHQPVCFSEFTARKGTM